MAFKPTRGLGAALLLGCLACATPANTTTAPEASRGGRTYTTQFPTSESSISENGTWITGRTTGLDWTDIAVTPGLAYGVETGTNGYDDATALLTGTWSPDQMAQGTVHTVNQNDEIFEEVGLRLRSTLSPHVSTGYEINFRCSKTSSAYAEIVRWSGQVGNFTYLSRGSGAQFGVADGDIVMATAVGSVITAYINGVQVLQTADHTYATGSPGMGLFLQGATGVNRDYGFTRFSASSAP